MPESPNDAADPAADVSAPDDDTAEASIVDADAGDATPEAPVETSTSDVEVDVVPVLPVPAHHRSKRSLALRFGISFVLAFVLAIGVGAGVLYAWGQQYDGRVLPGVSIGSTYLGGLTRDQAAAEIASAYGSLGNGQITLTGPDGHTKIISYADVGRGPDTSALVDAAFAAGRHGEPLMNLITGPQAAIRGVTLESVVAYDGDKLAAAVETLAATIDQTPTNAFVSTSQGGSFSVSPAKDGRAVDKAALLTALDQQLSDIGTPESIKIDVPVVSLPPTFATTSAETAKAAADRMAAEVVITRNEDTWKIAGKSLASLIWFSTSTDGSIKPVFNEAGLDPLLKKLAKQVDRPAQNAGLKMVSGRIVATGTSHEGRTLKADGMKAAILSEIQARQAGAAARRSRPSSRPSTPS